MSKPTLYLMVGYPGAGKTTAAKVIADITGAVLLSSDQKRLEMFRHPKFTEDEHTILYKELDQLTEKLLKEGKSVIYDANLNRYQHRQDKYIICQRAGAHVVVVWLEAPSVLAKNRAQDYSRLHLWPENETPSEMFDRIVSVFEPPRESEQAIKLDGTIITKDYVKQALNL